MNKLEFHCIEYETVKKIKFKITTEKKLNETMVEWKFIQDGNRIDLIHKHSAFDPEFSWGTDLNYYKEKNRSISLANEYINLLIVSHNSKPINQHIKASVYSRIDSLSNQMDTLRKSKNGERLNKRIYNSIIEHFEKIKNQVDQENYSVLVYGYDDLELTPQVNSEGSSSVSIKLALKTGVLGKEVLIKEPEIDLTSSLDCQLSFEAIGTFFRLLQESGLFFEKDMTFAQISRVLTKTFTHKKKPSTYKNVVSSGYKLKSETTKINLSKLFRLLKDKVENLQFENK